MDNQLRLENQSRSSGSLDNQARSGGSRHNKKGGVLQRPNCSNGAHNQYQTETQIGLAVAGKIFPQDESEQRDLRLDIFNLVQFVASVTRKIRPDETRRGKSIRPLPSHSLSV
ncbi:unnamed protein product, partial [Nesidiocoris tenuis]